MHREGVPALAALASAGQPPVGVVTLKPELAALRSGAADYDALCRQHSLPLYQVADINDAESVALLRGLSLDVLFVIGWSQVLRTSALRTARSGVIGAHASLLPHNRGSAPVNWALIHGETQAGNTLLWLSEDLDAGDVIDQTVFCVTPYDSCATLYERVAASNRDMILRLLPRLTAGERPGRHQPPLDEPLLPRRRPADGLIDWKRDSRAIYDWIRALTRPYPGAFAWLDGRRWLVWHAALLPTPVAAAARPGEVVGPVVSPCPDACGQLVTCGSGAVVLLELERDDGQILAGAALSDQRWTGKVWTGG